MSVKYVSPAVPAVCAILSLLVLLCVVRHEGVVEEELAERKAHMHKAQIMDGNCPRHRRQSAALQSCIDGSKPEHLIGSCQSPTAVTSSGGVVLNELHHSKASSTVSWPDLTRGMIPW